MVCKIIYKAQVDDLQTIEMVLMPYKYVIRLKFIISSGKNCYSCICMSSYKVSTIYALLLT